MTKKYIGLMSGTSLDAVDVAVVEFTPMQLIATHSEPIPSKLKERLRKLMDPPYDKHEIDALGEADVLIGRLFAEAVNHLLEKNKLSPQSITAIGSHGQTIRHRPNQNIPFTLQIGDPNTIVARTGIATIADFRRRDMVLGGQGAPLAPLFHAYLLRTCLPAHKGRHKSDYWVINIGGMANASWIPPGKNFAIKGFDTGPGNILLDSWAREHLQKAYDDGGAWAASGTVYPSLLKRLLSDSYFQLPPPKSTGREYFNLPWLKSYLESDTHNLTPIDIQATLLELTAQTIRDATRFSNNKNQTIVLCGGGSRNQQLVRRLKEHYHPHPVTTTLELFGLHPDWVEAVCFAWLAKQALEKKVGNCPSVTGAQKSTILGAIYRNGLAYHD
jgi:anhydro-N-acetylmuramic acid kinase